MEETEMTAKNNVSVISIFLMATLAVLLFAAPPLGAQEEPTPVPEPPAAPEEPAAEEPEAEEPEAEDPAPDAAPAAPAAVAEPPTQPEPAEKDVPTVFREKTLITVNGRAEMNGYIELVVKPNNEEPIKVRANIVAKTKTKKITKELTSQLVFALGDRYKVKQTGDKTIRVVAKKKMPPVAISLMTQNLAGVAVMIGQG
jgi:hypothetical protein